MYTSMRTPVCRITITLTPWLAQAEASSWCGSASEPTATSPWRPRRAAAAVAGPLLPPQLRWAHRRAVRQARPRQRHWRAHSRHGAGRKPHRSQVNSEIERLLAEQKRIKAEKKALANDLKNAQRRRKRLKHKARLLSQLDLLEVLNLRHDEEKTKRPRTDGAAGELSAAAEGSDVDAAEDDERKGDEEAGDAEP